MAEDCDEGVQCTSPEFRNVADQMVNNMLPEKSGQRYLQTYSNFLKWQKDNKVDGLFSENILLVFFKEESKKKCGTTLWNTYSKLRCLIKKKNKVDISKYFDLLEFLKLQNKNHKPKQAAVFTNQEFHKFMVEATDQTYLATKVIFVFGLLGSCRVDEMVHLMTYHVKKIESPERMFLVSIPEENNTSINRSFTITDEVYFELVEKYINLRPAEMQGGPFFVTYHKGKCIKQFIRKREIAKAAKEIAKFLNLNPTDYKGYSFRRTSIKILADAGASMNEIKCQGGWKSTFGAERYVAKSNFTKRNNEKIITSFVNIPSNSVPVTTSIPQFNKSADVRKVDKFMFKTPKFCTIPKTPFLVNESIMLNGEEKSEVNEDFEISEYRDADEGDEIRLS